MIGISSTMVTVIALLLGLAVVAPQWSSTQFSPRLLRNFLRGCPNQIVLSVFVGTFAYSTGGLFEVGGVRRATQRQLRWAYWARLHEVCVRSMARASCPRQARQWLTCRLASGFERGPGGPR